MLNIRKRKGDKAKLTKGKTLLAAALLLLGFVCAAYPVTLRLVGNQKEKHAVAEMNQEFEKERKETEKDLNKEVDKKEYPVWTEWPKTILEIPKLSVEVAIGDMENKDVFKQDVNYPPAHYKETSYPGENGNVAIAGHRTGPADYFRKLNNLEEEDVIKLKTSKAVYEYRVERVFITDKNDWSVVGDSGYSCLTLTTCEAEGFVSHAKRLIVRAKLYKIELT